MNVQERIDKLRIKKGWSQSYLATQLGVSRNTVYSWYGKNPSTPKTETIQIFCETFEITLAEFFAEVDFNKISADESVLLELYRQLPKKYKEKVLDILHSFIEL